MIKLIGTLLLLITSVITGSLAAERLKARVKVLKQVRILLESLRLMIRYEALEVPEIIRRLGEDRELSGLRFLSCLTNYFADCFENGSMTFDEMWEKALNENTGDLPAEGVSVLSRTGRILGSCDCDGQLSALSILCEETDRLIYEAKEQYLAKGKLYRALGAVTGAFIAVIVV